MGCNLFFDSKSCSSLLNASGKFSLYTDSRTSEGIGDENTYDVDVSENEESRKLLEETNDEAGRLMKEIEITIEEVEQSRFCSKFIEQIEKSAAFHKHLKRVLGSHSQLQMVIYALGSMEYSYTPHYQLAIAILLQRHFSHWTGRIEVYDLVFSPADVLVLKSLGCDILSENEWARREVWRPTLFYMPYAGHELDGNLLGTNWCPKQMNQMIVLTNRYSRWLPYLDPEIYNETKIHMEAIQKYLDEIVVEANLGNSDDNIFYEFVWHFFDVNSDVDMETLFHNKISMELRLEKLKAFEGKCWHDFLHNKKLTEESFTCTFNENVQDGEDGDWSPLYGEERGPRRYRCHSVPPPTGWIQLNKGSDGNLPGGFGGICCNDVEDTIFSYHGVVHNVDGDVACLEAVRHGLEELIRVYPHKNLILEGDNLKVIQWVNKRPEPPDRIAHYLDKIFQLLQNFNSVTYHIYEEANLVAIDLAEKGAKSGKTEE